nr:type I restriction endonuclease [Salinihabitans flavidus]
MVARGKQKRADYVLYIKPNIPIAVIEAKDNSHSVGDGMQQALSYADKLRIPFAFSTNGDRFLFHDKTGQSASMETEIGLAEFPSPDELRGGSVCLNRFRAFCKWFSASARPLPLRASAG